MDNHPYVCLWCWTYRNCFKYKEKTYEIIKIGLDILSKPIFISICLPNDLTRVDKFELENLST